MWQRRDNTNKSQQDLKRDRKVSGVPGIPLALEIPLGLSLVSRHLLPSAPKKPSQAATPGTPIQLSDENAGGSKGELEDKQERGIMSWAQWAEHPSLSPWAFPCSPLCVQPQFSSSCLCPPLAQPQSHPWAFWDMVSLPGSGENREREKKSGAVRNLSMETIRGHQERNNKQYTAKQ